MQKSIPVITVDGPSGAGKGTVCRLVARELGYSLLDSGALYRLTALAANKQGASLQSESALELVARELDVSFELESEQVVILLSGEDVTAAIRTESVGMDASIVAALPSVRDALLARQRGFAQLPGLVADGRDMGTVVFPDALVKVYLTASAEERARRRLLQLKQAGETPILEAILGDIKARDERDSSREASPLKPAEDALLLDSTELSIGQVVSRVLEQVHLKEKTRD